MVESTRFEPSKKSQIFHDLSHTLLVTSLLPINDHFSDFSFPADESYYRWLLFRSTITTMVSWFLLWPTFLLFCFWSLFYVKNHYAFCFIWCCATIIHSSLSFTGLIMLKSISKLWHFESFSCWSERWPKMFFDSSCAIIKFGLQLPKWALVWFTLVCCDDTFSLWLQLPSSAGLMLFLFGFSSSMVYL